MRSYREELDRLAELGLKRSPRLVSGPQGPRVRIGGREAILLCSNDYLGLANDLEVKKAAIEAVERYGLGAGASRLVSGNMEPHEALEERIRVFYGAEDAILFNSGYNANLGVITALSGRSADIFSDRLNHASIVDACAMSRAKVRRYASRDAASLESALKNSTAGRRLIVTEGVFSMDGGMAPLGDIADLLDRYGATLILDDAHALGVIGKTGRGTLEHFAVPDSPSIIRIGTLGKAAGSFGAFAAGSKDAIGLLRSTARPFIYTTALPPAVCAGAAKAFDIMDERPELRERLRENTAFMKKGLLDMGLDTLQSETQIIPVLTGSAQRTMEISSRLLDMGVFIQGIRPPTVPENTGRLRITTSAAHSTEDLGRALKAIKEVFSGLPG